MLELERIEKSPHYKVLVHLPDGLLIKGTLTSDISFSVSSSYTTPFAESRASEEAAELYRGVASVVDSLAGSDLTSIRLRFAAQKLEHFIATEKPEVTIEFIVIAKSSQDDTRDVVRKLGKCLFSAQQTGGLGLVKAPLGYAVDHKNITAQGTVNIKVGQWLTFRDQIVVGMDSTFSKEVTPNGTPLFVQISLRFRYFGWAKLDTFEGWFS